MRIPMRDEYIELLKDHLDAFVNEIMNDKFKGPCSGVQIPNPDLAFHRGYLNGMCCALNCSFEREGDTWFIRDGRKHVIAKRRETWEDET